MINTQIRCIKNHYTRVTQAHDVSPITVDSVAPPSQYRSDQELAERVDSDHETIEHLAGIAVQLRVLNMNTFKQMNITYIVLL